MSYPSIFSKEVSQQLVDRVNQLSPDAQAQWGKMSVAQMLKHCNVPFEMVYEPEKFKKPSGFEKFIIKLLAKNVVVGDKPYKKNGRTAPEFIVTAKQNFEEQKNAITNHIWRVQQEGATTFDGRESHAMGPLSTKEWSNLFYKHLDHHLTQFGV